MNFKKSPLGAPLNTPRCQLTLIDLTDVASCLTVTRNVVPAAEQSQVPRVDHPTVVTVLKEHHKKS